MKDTRKLRNADHPIVGQIRNGGLADDRGHVMFAVRLKRNVLEQDDFVVTAHFLEHAAKVLRRVFFVADAIFFPCHRHTLGCIEQAFARGIVSGPLYKSADGILDMLGHRRLCARIVLVGSN